tara:strand:+ start:689 stop:1138 length:450 start_codon:yes stop_codon:yes gene_type:complete
MDNTTVIDNCLLNLKIISKLEENDKLITNQDILKIDKPVIFQGIKRWYSKEGRDTTMEKLNQIFNESFKITDELLLNEKSQQNIDNNLSDSNSQIFQKFIVEFTNSINGIDNLKKTYKDDVPMKSQLDMIGSKLTNRLEKMNKMCKITL